MENLPTYISLGFVATTLVTVYMFYLASGKNKKLVIVLLAIALTHGILAITGFYADYPIPAPKIATILGPTVLLMLFAFLTRKGQSIIDRFDLKIYTYLHSIRVPVEFVLLGLFLHHALPESMTFEGRNFDVLSGLTAPLVAYFGFQKQKLGRSFLVFWNVICLLLVLQVVVTGILSLPTTFQLLSFDQPNVGVLHVPYIWLPGLIVPIVIFGHLITLRKLLTG